MSQLLMRRPTLDNLPPMPTLAPEWVLRPVLPADVPALAELLSAAFVGDVWTEARVGHELTDATDVIETFVIAETTGEGTQNRVKIVATASARLLPVAYPHAGYVHWVAALPGYSGKGLGFAVTLATLQKFSAVGCGSAVLETDDARLPAIKTYLKLGFEPVYREESHAERWAMIYALLTSKQ